MKKQTFFQLFFILLALGFYQTSNAQISMGVRGGMLINNMDLDFFDLDADFDEENVIGAQFAVPVEIALGDMFAIQPELMYGSHGHRLTYSETFEELGITYTSDQKITFNINTLEIPVLGKVKFGSGKLKFNILAGPSFGFGMNGEVKAKYAYTAEDANGDIIDEDSDSESLDGKFVKNNYDEDDLDDDEFPLSKTNLNLHFGGGIAYDLGKASIFFDARYILGLNDHFPDYEDADSDEKITGKSRRIGLGLGVMFPLN